MNSNNNLVYVNKNCLNTKRPYSKPCQLCIDNCPNKAISESRVINPKLCNGCGQCIAICPSDGWVSKVNDSLLNYISTHEALFINCCNAVKKEFEIPCLALLDQDCWRSLVLLAQKDSASIYSGICSDCQNGNAAKASLQNFRNIFYGELTDHNITIIEMPEPSRKDNKRSPISRREVFSLLGTMIKTQIESSLIETEGYLIPKSREVMLEILRGRPNINVPFVTLAITDECTCCGVCAAICPQTALSKKIQDGACQIILEPYKCVQCSRCTASCPANALKYQIEELSYEQLTDQAVLHEGSRVYCSGCGKEIYRRTELMLCSACAP